MIASSDPGAAVGCGQQCLDLGAGEEIDFTPIVSLVRDSEDALKVSTALRIMKAGELAEGTDGGQAQVAGSRRIAAPLLDMVQEGADEVGIKIGQLQPTKGVCAVSLARTRRADERCRGRQRLYGY